MRTVIAARARVSSSADAAADPEAPRAGWRWVPVRPDDELPDMLERIRQQRASRVCLVVEQDIPALQSMVALRALRSLAAAGQVTLGVYGRNRALNDLARAAGWETPASPPHEAMLAANPPPRAIGVQRGRRQGGQALQQVTPRSPTDGMGHPVAGPSRRGQFLGLGWLWDGLRRAWRGGRPVPAARRGRPSSAADALAAVAAESAERLRQSHSSLALPPRDAGASAASRWSAYRYAAAHDAVVPLRRGAPISWSSWVPLLLTLAAVLIAGGVGWFVLPSARVTLETTPVPYATAIALIADPQVREVLGAATAAARVPAYEARVEQAGTKEIPTTGRQIVGEGRARGEVVFTNKLAQPATVPQGTVVTAGTIRFETTADVTIPGTVSQGPQRSSVGMRRVGVVARQAGTAGNVGPLAIDAVEGPLAAVLEVRNNQATQGGTDRAVTFVAAEDQRRLYDMLFAQLRAQAVAKMQKQVRPGEESLVIWPEPNPAVVQEVYTPPNVGDEATTVRLQMKVVYRATRFRGNDVNRALARVLAARVDEVAPGSVIVDELLQIQPPEVLRVEPGVGVVHLLVRTQGYIEPRIDPGKLRADLAGHTREEAQAQLATLKGFTATQLEVWPQWIERLPRLPFRIDVQSRRAAVAG